MSSKSRTSFFLSDGLCLFIACSKDPLIPFDEPEKELRPNLPEIRFFYGTDTFPAYFNSPPLSFTNSSVSTITSDGATLRRVLFYERKLSTNNIISCGSYHIKSKAFSDSCQFSSRFEGGLTNRNSMAMVNTRFSYPFK